MKNKYSFKDILEKEVIIDSDEKKVVFNKIEIPMIQRDYAQGRAETSSTRLNETGKRFLDSIFKALEAGKEMEMDFVYGSISKYVNQSQNEEYTLIPLDGQQRLTTLFLLYWYIGSRELKETKPNLMDSLKKFTYSTRLSSRRFCELLCKVELEFNEIPSSEISNLSEFFHSYKKDPTIKAMLNMLDAIHEKYSECKNIPLYANLEKLQFYILTLNDFGLTEDLYIKMNARGKQLTDFENFKADLINWMKSNDDFQKKVDSGMLYYMSISQKIDNQWTDMFWKLSKNKDDKLIDPFFMKFFYRYFLNKYILGSELSIQLIEKEDDFKFFASEASFRGFDIFEKHLSYDEIKTFEKIFDTLEANWDDIHNSICPSWGGSYSVLADKLEQPELPVFCAVMLYLEKNDISDIVYFKQWMRIVWNITKNTDITNLTSAIGVMKLIAELSDGSANIYEYLANSQLVIKSDSSKIAIDEEKQKCSLIYSNGQFCPEWEDAFIEAEKHPFFKGSVNFLISENMQVDEFKHRTELAKKVFDGRGVNEKYRKDGHIFLRALISQYTSFSQIDGKNFTDTYERENYLKKMLASHKVVQTATKEWFSLNNETDLMNRLNEEVKKVSTATGDSDDIKRQRWLKRVHEELYTKPELQDWMQLKKAIRLGWRGDELYISKPYAWYDRILLGRYRNEIISKLLDNPYNCSTRNECRIKEDTPIPYYWGTENIILTRVIPINGDDISFEYYFDTKYIRIGIRETADLTEKFSNIQFSEPTTTDDGEKEEGWICRNRFNYQEEVTQEEDIDAFIKKIESEVFTGQNSLMSKLKANL